MDGGSGDEYRQIYANWTYEGFTDEEIDDFVSFTLRVRDQTEGKDLVFQNLEKGCVKGETDDCLFRISMERNSTVDGHRYACSVTARSSNHVYSSETVMVEKKEGSPLDYSVVVRK